MDDADLALALALQEELNNESLHTPSANQQNHGSSNANSKKGKSPSLVDQFWELTDPNPDIRALFLQFNERFFWGRLAGIEVKWSPRMTVCAGICCYEGRGGLCSVRLSTPLLKLRPRKDLVETLLHEMIHAYLFVTDNNKDHDGHGPEFHKHMYRINGEAGTKISVYHSFHDEVAVYKTHWWKCNGPCQKRHPYFGMVKRSMNRAPSKNDTWWAEHQRTCGGTYAKVKEPEGFGQKKGGKKSDKDYKSDSDIGSNKKTAKSPDIRSFWGKGQPNDKKPATITSGSVNTDKPESVITNGVLYPKSSSGSNTGHLTHPVLNNNNTNPNQPNLNKGNNSSSTDSTNLNKTSKTSSDSDSNVMRARTIWNKNKDKSVTVPPFTDKGKTLGKGTENQTNSSSSVLDKKTSNASGSGNSDLNVMKATTIWSIDKEKPVSQITFTGTGETLGSTANTGMSWLAKLRREIGIPGKRKRTSDIVSTSEKGLNNSKVKLLNKTFDSASTSEKAGNSTHVKPLNKTSEVANKNSHVKQPLISLNKTFDSVATSEKAHYNNHVKLLNKTSDFVSTSEKALNNSHVKQFLNKTSETASKNSHVKLLNKTGSVSTSEKAHNKSHVKPRKIKKARLVLSDSDDELTEPLPKRQRRSNSPFNQNSSVSKTNNSTTDNSCDLPVIKTKGKRPKHKPVTDDLSETSNNSNFKLPQSSDKYSASSSTIPTQSSSNTVCDDLPVIKSPQSKNHNAVPSSGPQNSVDQSSVNTPMANCPVCQLSVATSEINNHLDMCLTNV